MIDIGLQVRLRILNMAVCEYAKAFGADESTLNIIEKGVLNQQLLNDIVIQYMDSENNIIALITISIDWEKHIINANDKGIIEIDDSKPILSQLDRATSTIINHTVKLREEYNVKEVITSYRYKEEIRGNPEELEKARKYLGLSQGANKAEKISKSFMREIELVIDSLDEIKIVVKHD